MTLSLMVCSAEALWAGEPVCAQDKNHNGHLGDPGELAVCTGGGGLCPFDTVDCRFDATPVSCPAQMEWNSVLKQCQVSPLSHQFYVKVLTGSGRSRNDCNCKIVNDAALCEGAPTATQVAAVFSDAKTTYTRIGFSVENFRDRKRRRGHDVCSFDTFDYYLVRSQSCGPETSLMGGFCVASPTCSQGSYEPSTGSCVTPVCPLGSNYSCILNHGKHQCSAISCIDLKNNPPDTEDPDLTSYQNDSHVDSAGTCQGEVLLFNGKPKTCRHTSPATNFFSCCNSSQPDLERCSPEENDLIQKRAGGVCHLVGTFCKSRSKILGCLQKAETFCCFPSKLARIIHEQGRSQLRSFTEKNLWGQPKTPECGGFSVTDFQALDFSKINLEEYLASQNVVNNLKFQDLLSNDANQYENP